MAVLQSLTSVSALEARIAELEAQLAAKSQRGLACKVTDKGGVSVYGLGKFPVTLYKSQWERLIAFAPSISAYLKANDSKLASKGE